MQKLVFGATLAACLFLVAGAEQGVDVKIKKLVEKRVVSLMAKEDDLFAEWDKGIELTLYVDGPAVAEVKKYKIKVTQAIDDTGTDLTAKRKNKSLMQVVDESGFRVVPERSRLGFEVDVKLPSLPKRSSTVIKTLSGEMQVMVGGEKVAFEAPVKVNYGKKINHAALSEAGITFTLADAKSKPAFQKGEHAVNAKITGDPELLESVEFFSDVKRLSYSAGWQDENGVRNVSYNLEAPLPDDAVVKIEMYRGQKMVTVPFKFENVKLP